MRKDVTHLLNVMCTEEEKQKNRGEEIK